MLGIIEVGYLNGLCRFMHIVMHIQVSLDFSSSEYENQVVMRHRSELSNLEAQIRTEDRQR
jgi:hypothetical protein